MLITSEQLPSPTHWERMRWGASHAFQSRGHEIPYNKGGTLDLRELKIAHHITLTIIDGRLILSKALQALIQDTIDHQSVRQAILGIGGKLNGEAIKTLSEENHSAIVHLPDVPHALQLRRLVREIMGRDVDRTVLLSNDEDLVKSARQAGIHTITNDFGTRR